jgi:hypothetical protein
MQMKKRFPFLFFAALLALSARTGHGVTPDGEIETDSDVRPALRMELYSWAYSSPFLQFNGKSASVGGADDEPVQLINQLTIATPAFGPMDWEFTPQFIFQPLEGDRFQILDGSVGLEGNLWEGGGWTYWARYEFVLPLSSNSRESGMVLAPQAVQNLSFQFPGTRLRTELSFTPTLSIFDNSETAFSLYLSPRIFYELSPSFSLFTMLEVGFESERGASPWDLTAVEDATLGLGFRYASRSGEGFWVQPFLDFYPAGDVLANAHLGVFFGGPLL